MKELEYVDEQTDEICMIAVKKNKIALKHVIKQTDEICLEAIQKNLVMTNK
jgi:hypothetical protein